MAKHFNPDHDIPSLQGKVIVITGGTAGLGEGSIKELSKHSPSHIIFTGRKEEKAKATIKHVKDVAPDVQLTFIPCDTSSLSSTQQAAHQILNTIDRLDILMLNAGIMATEPAVSKEGYESQFATNYLGHTLLVKLLLPLMAKTEQQHQTDVRVVNMTSIAYKQAPSQGIDFATLKSSQAKLGGALIPGHKWARYGQSKLAQLLYSQELAQHYPQIFSVSVHPGYIMTGLFDGPDFMTKLPVLVMSAGRKTPVHEGHYAQCWAATCPKNQLRNGEYYEPIGRVGKRATAHSKDTKLAAELWEWTENELKSYT